MNKVEVITALKKLGRVGLVLIATLTACGVKPSVTHTIESCGGKTEVDTASGSLEEIKAPGIELQYKVNDDGTITYLSKPAFTDSPPSERSIGNLNDSHLKVNLLGDTDNDGKQNIEFQSVCPAPQPTETPIGLLKGTMRSVVQADRGFHPGEASKPAFSARSVYRKG
ncbi:MAG: hypothetical protein V1803_01185 [Candidatus Roizmanbacteria bacterium]